MKQLLIIAIAFVVLTPALFSQSGGRKKHVGLERAFPRLRFDRPVYLCGAGDGSGRPEFPTAIALDGRALAPLSQRYKPCDGQQWLPSIQRTARGGGCS